MRICYDFDTQWAWGEVMVQDSFHTFQSGYYQGYTDGYRDGVAGRENGCGDENTPLEIVHFPIEIMAVSHRAVHCLQAAGCVRISDVVSLPEGRIASMRGLGRITASEIANWLLSQGIRHSAWNRYL